MEKDNEIEIKSGNFNGKEIFLSYEICFNWGYDVKISLVNKLGNLLTKKGFNVKIFHKPSNIPILFKIYLDNFEEKILIFSNDLKDKGNGVCISKYPRDCYKDLVKNILRFLNKEYVL